MNHDPDDTPRDLPQEWVDALERSRVEIAAGRTAPCDEVRARLLARIAEAEAAQARRRA